MTIAFGRRRLVASLGLVALALSACESARSIGSGSGDASKGGDSAPSKPPPPPSANEKAADEMPVKPLRVVSTLTGTGSGGAFAGPSGVAVDKQGALYVADLGGKRVAHFGPDGKLVREWKGGSGDAAFDLLVDITIGPGGN